jgi:hypothetical protein
MELLRRFVDKYELFRRAAFDHGQGVGRVVSEPLHVRRLEYERPRDYFLERETRVAVVVHQRDRRVIRN